MSANYQELNFYNMNKYEFIVSSDSNFIILKMNLQFASFDAISKEVNLLLKNNYLEQPGVYFLKLNNGYYIGETKELKTRLKNHIENRDVRSITIATHKSHVDSLEKGDVRDLEALLLEYAKASGLTIGSLLENKKGENRKILNSIAARRNEITATYLWDGIRQLNLKELWEDLTIGNSPQENSKEVNKIPQKLIVSQGNIASEDTIQGPNQTSEIIISDNVRDHNVNPNLDIFRHIPYRKNVSDGYNSPKIEIFSQVYQEDCLFKYLFENYGGPSIDKIMTKNLKSQRKNGYVTSATLAYFRIETNGDAKGKLSHLSIDDAKKMIKDLVYIK